MQWQGKVHFGIILGWSVLSAIVLWFVVKNISGDSADTRSCNLGSCYSVLGYALLPMVLFSILSVLLPKCAACLMPLATATSSELQLRVHSATAKANFSSSQLHAYETCSQLSDLVRFSKGSGFRVAPCSSGSKGLGRLGCFLSRERSPLPKVHLLPQCPGVDAPPRQLHVTD